MSTPARTRVKFCGITRAEDAQAAVQLGVDAIGLVQVPASPRFIGLAPAAIIRARVPKAVQVVTLFQNPSVEQVQASIAALAPDVLQFHGDEPPEFCERFGLPYWKAVPMARPQDIAGWGARHPRAAALLLDGHAPGEQGGRGRTFDWARVRPAGKPLLLAGGLTPSNVHAAIQAVHPDGVDVSSGIEAAPGIKDPDRMQRFVDAVRRADAA